MSRINFSVMRLRGMKNWSSIGAIERFISSDLARNYIYSRVQEDEMLGLYLSLAVSAEQITLEEALCNESVEAQARDIALILERVDSWEEFMEIYTLAADKNHLKSDPILF